MIYTPQYFTWELTRACNLKCNFCGSNCSSPLPDELNTLEACDTAHQIADLRLRRGTLLGGEPLMRKDWHVIAEELTHRGVQLGMVTNGTLIDEVTARKMREVGLSSVSCSLDGIGKKHDRLRGEGVYKSVERAFALLREQGITTSSNTTLMQQNLGDLEEIWQALKAMNVDTWQLQPALPMGRMDNQKDQLLQPKQLKGLFDFVLEANGRDGPMVMLSENMGYYCTTLQTAIQSAYKTDQPYLWQGCHAGKRSLGIMHNGDITGCVSIRDQSYIAGSIREESLSEIWNNSPVFAKMRQRSAEDLQGSCSNCQYGEYCLGGCTSTRLAFDGNLDGEYPFCLYAHSLQKL